MKKHSRVPNICSRAFVDSVKFYSFASFGLIGVQQINIAVKDFYSLFSYHFLNILFILAFSLISWHMLWRLWNWNCTRRFFYVPQIFHTGISTKGSLDTRIDVAWKNVGFQSSFIDTCHVLSVDRSDKAQFTSNFGTFNIEESSSHGKHHIYGRKDEAIYAYLNV